MSLKYSVEQVGPSHFVLPRRGAMRCEVHAYLSPALYEASEEAMWAQAAQAAEYEGATGLYLMPDCHLGYGIPVGGVLVTDDTIVQAGSGFDISCGVVYLEVPGLHASDIADPATRQRWVAEVGKRVATGVGAGRAALAPKVSHRLAQEVVRYGARAMHVPAEVCERHYIPVPEDIDFTTHAKAWPKVQDQLGSVGGGNHFIEMQVDRDDGSVWVMIHCGSRGYGWQVADSFFTRGAELRGLPRARREESWLRRDEPLGEEYWAWHNSAANFAIANRHMIVRGVQEATEVTYAKTPTVFYEISHNLVQEERLVLPDGTEKRGFVHRKGATRAFPAHHPQLKGTAWEETGHPVCIPGSMLAGAAILQPLPNAHHTACSVNHGSGRLLARGAAKAELAPMQGLIDDEMRTIKRTLGGVEVVGIVGNTEKTPLDECGHVYKDLDAVLDVLVAEGIAKVTRRLYPVANLKGTD